MSKGFKRTFVGLLGLGAIYGGLVFLSNKYIDYHLANKTGFFEVNVNIPKADRIDEDFSGLSEEEIKARNRKEFEFYSSKSSVDINSVYDNGGIIYFSSENCGPCKSLDECVFNEFAKVFKNRLKIIKFNNTFDNEANCVCSTIANSGTPSIVFFDDKDIIGRKDGFNRERTKSIKCKIYNEAGDLINKTENSYLLRTARFLSGRY